MSTVVIWGLTDGSAGMVSQVRGVGEALAEKLKNTPTAPSFTSPACGGGKEGAYGGINVEFLLKSARRIRPFRWLPGNFCGGALKQLTKDSDALTAPYPDILISSGRRSVALALAIKKASGGKTKLVHLQGPRIALHHFDLVVPMVHDRLEGKNVISTFAALHHITDPKLAEAKDADIRWVASPSPHTLFLLGGSTHAYTLSKKRMAQLLAQLIAYAEQHSGSIWISTSRRTGHKNIEILRQALKNTSLRRGALDENSSQPRFQPNPPPNGEGNIIIYAGEGENPYLAWLARADRIVVTNDSVNMMSEALSTGKPLYILPLPEHRGTKPAHFADALMARSLAQPFELPLKSYTPQKIDEKEKLVESILQLSSRGASQ